MNTIVASLFWLSTENSTTIYKDRLKCKFVTDNKAINTLFHLTNDLLLNT